VDFTAARASEKKMRAAQLRRSRRLFSTTAALPPRSDATRSAMLRVDHAGELGAVEIYRAQAWVLRGTPAEPMLRGMQAGEEEHLRTIEALMAARRVRPSLLLPLWRAAGFALGAATALLGRRSAMAATVSVETAISGHYNAQVRELLEAGGGGLRAAGDDEELVKVFSKHRDEEVEHHDAALAQGARDAPAFAAQDAAIKAGCALAIQITTRV
jgi:ubiquinone biosynthesis monooxygenase Coq7